MSLTITAMRRLWELDRRMCSRRVVFPLPKKPDRRVTGSCLRVVFLTLMSVVGHASPRSVVAIGGILLTFFGWYQCPVTLWGIEMLSGSF